MAVERTLVLVKPDAVARRLIGEVVARIERKGLDITAMQLRTLDRETAGQHYGEHEGKAFFDELVSFITSGPVVAMQVEGEQAVTAVRTLIGPTDPVKAQPGTIRGDFALDIGQNLVHGSDSVESGERELKLFFS
jgi:nucleoside-diphosphate kinase